MCVESVSKTTSAEGIVHLPLPFGLYTIEHLYVRHSAGTESSFDAGSESIWVGNRRVYRTLFKLNIQGNQQPKFTAASTKSLEYDCQEVRASASLNKFGKKARRI